MCRNGYFWIWCFYHSLEKAVNSTFKSNNVVCYIKYIILFTLMYVLYYLAAFGIFSGLGVSPRSGSTSRQHFLNIYY